MRVVLVSVVTNTRACSVAKPGSVYCIVDSDDSNKTNAKRLFQCVALRNDSEWTPLATSSERAVRYLYRALPLRPRVTVQSGCSLQKITKQGSSYSFG
eukprot:jgi/Psemu1/309666/fgenesh1_kg.541_\